MLGSGARHTVRGVCDHPLALPKALSRFTSGGNCSTLLRQNSCQGAPSCASVCPCPCPPTRSTQPSWVVRRSVWVSSSIWYAEHPAVPVNSASPFPATGGAIPLTYSHFTEPYIALARASAVTTTLKLATGITLVPQRNPLILAKEVAALDLPQRRPLHPRRRHRLAEGGGRDLRWQLRPSLDADA